MKHLLIIAAALLVACSESNPWILVETKEVNAKITAIDQPKHFWVNIDVDGTPYNGVGSSKHCNAWRRNSVGDVVITTRQVYERKTSEGLTERITKFPRLNSQLCGG